MVSNRLSEDIPNAKMGSKMEIDSEKALPETSSREISVASLPEVPEGGRRAWLVASGSACVVFCSLGFVNSFGTLEQYYLTHQLSDQDPSKVAWIGSITLFLQWVSGMIGGPLFDRYGEKALWAPAVVYVFAIMMLSLCYEYWHFMLVQGVIIGVSSGVMQFPAFAASSQYFVKRRALAIGLVVSGSSIGGVTFPIALSKMLNDSGLGFGWSMRITGFMVMPLLLFSCVAIKARLPPRKTQFFLWRVYKEKLFMTLIASLFFIFAGMMMPFFYLPTYAVMKGMDVTKAGYLPAVINGASTVGRIGLGLIADKYGRLNMYALTALSTAVIVFCLSSVETNAGFYVYAVFFGLGSGSVISSVSTCFSLCPKDPRDIGTYLGMGLALAGFGSLIGPPVDGAMIIAYQSYFQVSMLSGALCFVGGVLAVATKLFVPQGLFSKY